MKLKNQTHGPITLSSIDYAANLSQETNAFTAKVEINGLKGTVQNEGMGGPNNVWPRDVEVAIEAYAKTLPDENAYGLAIAQTADLLLGIMVENAIIQHEQEKEVKRMVKKGYKFQITHGDRIVYSTMQPSTASLVKHFGHADVTVRAIA